MTLNVASMVVVPPPPSTDCELIAPAEVEPVPLDIRLSQPGGGSTLVGISW
jgi:hypothetical protein